MTKKTKDVILTVQEGPAPAGTTKHWNLSMEVPPIPPSNLVNCNIIDLDYDLKVSPYKDCSLILMYFVAFL